MAPVEIYRDGELDDTLDPGQTYLSGMVGKASFAVQSEKSGGKYAKGVCAGLLGGLARKKPLAPGETVDLGNGTQIKGV